MKKRLLSLALAAMLLVSVLMLAGCGGSSSSSAAASTAAESTAASTGESAAAEGGSDEGSYRIGISFDYLSDFMATCVDGANGFAADNANVEVTINDADWDVAKQLQHAENYISSGYSAVLIKPVDGEGCGPISAACKEAGVPFVVINSNITDEKDVYVGSDNVMGGEMQMEIIVDTVGESGKVAVLQGDLMNEAAVNRSQGYHNIVDQYDGWEIVSEQEAGWMRDEAMTKMENWLNSGIEIDAVVANNDEMALGAAMVLQEAGITDIVVVGIDATEDALKAMKDGIMHGTVFQDGYQQAYQGCDAAIKLAKGEEVSEYVDIPYVKVMPEEADTYLNA